MYSFNHLYYFYVTAKSGGVNAAAKRLNISQPSLTSQLKKLEQALGVRLFQKVGRRNTLTASRCIHIGVSDEVDRPFVIEVVSLFFKKMGPIHRSKVTVVSGSQEQLEEDFDLGS